MAKDKKKVSFKRTVSNNMFAVSEIWRASPFYLIVYLGSSFIYGTLDFLSESYLLRKVLNGINVGERFFELVRYIVLVGAASIFFNLIMNWFWQVESQKHYHKIWVSIEKRLFKKSAEVELACYENPAFYDRYVKAMDEAYHRMMKVMYTFDNLINKLVSLTANSLLLFFIDPWLILFGLFPLLLGFFKRRENVVEHEWQSAKKPLNRRAAYVRRTFYLNEYSKEMRVGGMYKNMLRDLVSTYEEYKKLAKKFGFKKAIYGFIRNMGLEVITILGATFYAVWSAMYIGPENGGMMIGDCIVVLNSIGTISYCLNDLVQNFAEFGEHALFLEDVRFFLDYEPKIEGGNEIAPNESKDLEVKRLCFRYEGAEEDTLKDISFTIKKGERVALVGSNGSGKTTLVKLLLRLYDADSGEITLDGKNIKEFTLDSYRGSFSTVMQDFKMFSMSVKENVLLRPTKDGDDELVKEALIRSGAYDKISKFDKGLDTILTREFDDKGENLSVGEAQKLSLARIFADKTPFVILDEPSSALDPIAEYKMFENMMQATEGRSVIFISHRLCSAVLADKVLLMDKGRIVESGTHTQLMEKNGKYAAMFKLQAEKYLGSGEGEDE